VSRSLCQEEQTIWPASFVAASGSPNRNQFLELGPKHVDSNMWANVERGADSFYGLYTGDLTHRVGEDGRVAAARRPRS
jgi:hypothetical protein